MSNPDDLRRKAADRQRQWLRERDVDSQKGGIQSVNPGDLVNKLTDKITSKVLNANMKGQEVEAAVTTELETNNCPICFELMIPKLHSPMLLFPCGHTFCQEWIIQNEKKNSNKKCPAWRSVVKSKAINHSLQNLIVAYAKKVGIRVDADPAPTMQRPTTSSNPPPRSKTLDDYINDLEMFNLRIQILNEEKRENLTDISELDYKLQQCQRSIQTLQHEEQGVLSRLEAIKTELNLVRDHISSQENLLDDFQREKQEKHANLSLIQETIEPLLRDKDKTEALINIQAYDN